MRELAIATLRPISQKTILPYVNWTIMGEVLMAKDRELSGINYREVRIADDTGSVNVLFPEIIESAKEIEVGKTYKIENLYAKMEEIVGKVSTKMLVFPRVEKAKVEGKTYYEKISIKEVSRKYPKLNKGYHINEAIKCEYCQSLNIMIYNVYDDSLDFEPYYGCIDCHTRMLPYIEQVKPTKPNAQRMLSWKPTHTIARGPTLHKLPTYFKKRDSIFKEIEKFSDVELQQMCQFLDLDIEMEKKEEPRGPAQRLQAHMQERMMMLFEGDESNGEMIPKTYRDKMIHKIRLHWPTFKFDSFKDFLLAFKVYQAENFS